METQLNDHLPFFSSPRAGALSSNLPTSPSPFSPPPFSEPTTPPPTEEFASWLWDSTLELFHSFAASTLWPCLNPTPDLLYSLAPTFTGSKYRCWRLHATCCSDNMTSDTEKYCCICSTGFQLHLLCCMHPMTISYSPGSPTARKWWHKLSIIALAAANSPRSHEINPSRSSGNHCRGCWWISPPPVPPPPPAFGYWILSDNTTFPDGIAMRTHYPKKIHLLPHI